MVLRFAEEGHSFLQVSVLVFLSHLEIQFNRHSEGVLHESVHSKRLHESNALRVIGGVEGLNDLPLTSFRFSGTQPADTRRQVELQTVRECQCSTGGDLSQRTSCRFVFVDFSTTAFAVAFGRGLSTMPIVQQKQTATRLAYS